MTFICKYPQRVCVCVFFPLAPAAALDVHSRYPFTFLSCTLSLPSLYDCTAACSGLSRTTFDEIIFSSLTRHCALICVYSQHTRALLEETVRKKRKIKIVVLIWGCFGGEDSWRALAVAVVAAAAAYQQRVLNETPIENQPRLRPVLLRLRYFADNGAFRPLPRHTLAHAYVKFRTQK